MAEVSTRKRGQGVWIVNILPKLCLGRGTTRRVVEGYSGFGASHPSTVLRTVPLPEQVRGGIGRSE
jgi:hypothetical protein